MITFSSYMNEWLYGERGYYRYALIGKSGDFYTSVCASKFFGGAIAYYLLGLLEDKKITLPIKIIEIGADKGFLLSDVVQFLQAMSEGVIEECGFISIEPLEELRLQQKNNFLQQTGLELQVYQSFEDLKLDSNDCVFVFCNEIFDAFACELVYKDKMAYIDNHQVLWKEIPSEIVSLMQEYRISLGEVPIYLQDFITRLTKQLQETKKWIFLTFDYGQWGSRNDVNLRIYQNHWVSNFLEVSQNLENFYQKSDITYDVDFSVVARCFELRGAKQIFYDTQAKVLLDFGLLDLLEKFAQSTNYEIYLREITKIKSLISPGGLGERFKAIGFSSE